MQHLWATNSLCEGGERNCRPGSVLGHPGRGALPVCLAPPRPAAVRGRLWRVRAAVRPGGPDVNYGGWGAAERGSGRSATGGLVLGCRHGTFSPSCRQMRPRPLMAGRPAPGPQQGSDPPVAVPPEARGQPHDRGSKRRLVVQRTGTVALAGSGLAPHPAGPTPPGLPTPAACVTAPPGASGPEDPLGWLPTGIPIGDRPGRRRVLLPLQPPGQLGLCAPDAAVSPYASGRTSARVTSSAL